MESELLLLARRSSSLSESTVCIRMSNWEFINVHPVSTASGTMFAESSEQSTDIGIHRKLAVKTSFQLRAMK